MFQPANFQKKNRSLIPLLDKSRTETMGSLVNELALALRAGAVIAPIVKNMRLAIDFSRPGRCRVSEGKLILLVHDAAQHNKLRQMTSRMRAALAAKGLPFTEIEIHIITAQAEPVPRMRVAKGAARHPSVHGALALTQALPFIANPELKTVLENLKNVLTPDKQEYLAFTKKLLQKELLELEKQLVQLRQKHRELPDNLCISGVERHVSKMQNPQLQALFSQVKTGMNSRAEEGKKESRANIEQQLANIERLISMRKNSLDTLKKEPDLAFEIAHDFLNEKRKTLDT